MVFKKIFLENHFNNTAFSILYFLLSWRNVIYQTKTSIFKTHYLFNSFKQMFFSD